MITNQQVIGLLQQHFGKGFFTTFKTGYPVIKAAIDYLQSLNDDALVSVEVLDHLVFLFYPLLSKWHVEKESSDALKILVVLINAILKSIIKLEEVEINLNLLSIYKIYWFCDIKTKYWENENTTDFQQLDSHTLYLMHRGSKLSYELNTIKGNQQVALLGAKYNSIQDKIFPRWHVHEPLSLTNEETELLIRKTSKNQHFPVTRADWAIGEEHWAKIILSCHDIELTPPLKKIWKDSSSKIEFVKQLIIFHKDQNLANLTSILDNKWRKEGDNIRLMGVHWKCGGGIIKLYLRMSEAEKVLNKKNEKLLRIIFDLDDSHSMFTTAMRFCELEQNHALTEKDKCLLETYSSKDVFRVLKRLDALQKSHLLEAYKKAAISLQKNISDSWIDWRTYAIATELCVSSDLKICSAEVARILTSPKYIQAMEEELFTCKSIIGWTEEQVQKLLRLSTIAILKTNKIKVTNSYDLFIQEINQYKNSTNTAHNFFNKNSQNVLNDKNEEKKNGDKSSYIANGYETDEEHETELLRDSEAYLVRFTINKQGENTWIKSNITGQRILNNKMPPWISQCLFNVLETKGYKPSNEKGSTSVNLRILEY